MNVPGPIRLQVTSRSNSVNLGNEIAFLIGGVQEILSRNVQNREFIDGLGERLAVVPGKGEAR
jgi:hypothetical protein